MPDDKLTQLMGTLAPEEVQQLHTALTMIRAGKAGGQDIDTSKYNMDKVGRAWDALQPVVAGPQPKQFMGGVPREAALGALGTAAPEAVNAVSKMIDSMVQKPSLQNYVNPMAGVVDNIYGMGAQVVKGGTEVGQGVYNKDWQQAAHGAGTLLGSAAQLFGFREAGELGERPPVVPGRSALPVTEIPGAEVQRATPISSTGKTATSPKAPITTPSPPGAGVKGTSWGMADVSEVPLSMYPASEIENRAGLPTGVPEARKVATLPEVKAQTEIRIRQRADATQAAPNPSAGPQRLATASVEPPGPLLEAPVRPPGKFTKGQPEAIEYAAKRDAYMKQQKDLARARGEIAPTPAPTDPTGQFDVSLNRFVKTPGPESVRHVEDMRSVLRGIKDADPADIRTFKDNMSVRAAAATAQVAQLRRVAAAPDMLKAMAEEKGRPLLGTWERMVPGEGGEPTRALGKEEKAAFYKTTNLNEVSPAERDLMHEVMGHGTVETLTRDETGSPIKISDKDAQAYVDFVDRTRAEKAKVIKSWEDRGYPPTADEIDHAASLNDIIEAHSGLRNKLAREREGGQPVARKGLPITDEAGVVRAPGAIPDIGQKTGNALLDRPVSAHFKKPTPEKLNAFADRLEQARDLYQHAADFAAKKLAGTESPRVEVPEKPSVATQMRKIIPTTAPGTEYTGDAAVAIAKEQLNKDIAAYRKARVTPGTAPEKLHEMEDSIAWQRELIQDPETLVVRSKGLAREPEAIKVGNVYDTEGKLVGRKEMPVAPAPQERTSAQLGYPNITEEIDKYSTRLFGKIYADLSKSQRDKLSMSAVMGKELKRDPITRGLEMQLEKPPARVKSEPEQAQGPARHFASDFPMGEVADSVRAKVEALHGMATPEQTELLSKTVADQGLATREAAYKLYGRSLGKLLAGEKAGTPTALADALDVAKRRGEAGAIRATFLKDVYTAVRDKVTPGKNESEVTKAKSSIREEGAKEAQYVARTNAQLSKAEKAANKLPAAEQWQLQKDIETGIWRTKYAPDSPHYKIAGLIRTFLDENRELITQQTGKLKTFIENYFPHRWEGINNAADYRARIYGGRSALSKAPLLKERYYNSLQAGEDAGLKPVELNPVRAALNVMAEGAHFRKGQGILADLNAQGAIKTFKSPRFVPSDWEMLNPKVAGVGKYAPKDIAQMFNNYFDPGLFAKSRTLDAIRIYNNAAQIAAVSLSGYHVGLTTMEGFVTDISLGIKYATSGDLVGSARAFGRSVISPVDTMVRGSNFIRDMKAALPADIANNPVMKAFLEGGGRISMSRNFDTARWRDVQKSWIKATSPLGKVGAAAQAIPATLRMLSAPVQDFWVPRMKAGATVKMLQYELERLGPGATDSERGAAFREVIDSADNRFGQMVADNLFWNRTMRDAATLGFKFVDFNYGSIRELYGAGIDIPRAMLGQGMSHRLAHAFAFPAGIAIGGSILNYMLTGQGPRDTEDMFFPRNGRIGPDGKAERVMLPSYLRSFYEIGKPSVEFATGHPREAVESAATFAKGRLSPAVNLATEWITNRDFMGNAVVHKTDPFIQQVGQMVGSVIRQAQPISKSAYERSEELGGSPRDKWLAVAGIQNVPKALGLDQSPAERELESQLRDVYGSGKAAPEILAHQRAIGRLVQAERNKTGQFANIWREETAKGNIHPDRDIDTVLSRLEHPFIERVKDLTIERQVNVLEKVSTPNERAIVMEGITKNLDKIWDMPEKERTRLWNRISAASKQVPAGSNK